MSTPIKNAEEVIKEVSDREQEVGDKSDAVIKPKLIVDGQEPIIETLKDLNTEIELANIGNDVTIMPKVYEIGSTLIDFQDKVNKSGLQWEKFVENNVDFINERNRQKYMRIARNKEKLAPYNFSLDQAECVLSVVDKKAKDPIGDMIIKYELEKCTDRAEDIQAFRTCIYYCMNCEKLEKAGIAFNRPDIELLTKYIQRFNKSFIGSLQDIKNAGGDTIKHLEMLSANKGKSEKDKKDAKNLLPDINTLGKRLTRVIDELINTKDTFDTVKIAILDDVTRKIAELKASVSGN